MFSKAGFTPGFKNEKVFLFRPEGYENARSSGATKMNRDFTLAKYGELCNTIVQSGYAVMSVKDYLFLSLSLQPREKVVILRHDVDRKPEKALKMAEIERELGISGTYYFRSTKEVFKAGIMQEIEKMGHEVGYH